jgi:hypothetical protein
MYVRVHPAAEGGRGRPTFPVAWRSPQRSTSLPPDTCEPNQFQIQATTAFVVRARRLQMRNFTETAEHLQRPRTQRLAAKLSHQNNETNRCPTLPGCGGKVRSMGFAHAWQFMAVDLPQPPYLTAPLSQPPPCFLPIVPASPAAHHLSAPNSTAAVRMGCWMLHPTWHGNDSLERNVTMSGMCSCRVVWRE